MPTVVAAVVRCRRTFSGGTTCLVGDVGGEGGRGGRRDGPPRPFGCRAVMIAHMRVLAWWGPPVSGRCSHLQLMRAARAIRGARLLRGL
jgi:hypothetical protein